MTEGAKSPRLPNPPASLQARLEKLTERMVESSLYLPHLIDWVNKLTEELEQSGVHGVSRFVQLLSQRVGNYEDFIDIFREGRFAGILNMNGFSQIHIEYSKAGPDIKANYNKQHIYFEVRRRRPKDGESWEMQEARWVGFDRPENVIAIIQDKHSQFCTRGVGILVLWSDTIELTEFNAKDVVSQEFNRNGQQYTKMGGVLFTTGGVDILGTLQQFYLVKNLKASKLIGKRLESKLESLHEQDLGVLQKSSNDLKAAMVKLRAARNP